MGELMDGADVITGEERGRAIAELLSEARDLASPPEVCVRLFELMRSETAGAKEIGEVIALDPNLTARLLELVNSAYFGMARRVDTVSRAVTIVGLRELHQLVLAVQAVSVFSNIPITLVDMRTFWRHSVATALLAKELARRAGVLHPERLFVAGLLHDLGSLVLYRERPEVMRELLIAADGDEAVMERLEEERLGFGHAELGGALLACWNLPPELCRAVTHHHRPLEAPGPGLEPAIVHLADGYANTRTDAPFCSDADLNALFDPRVAERIGLGADDVDAAIGAALPEVEQTQRILAIG
ncbi:putative nucleotidyltransferase with HDIG domain [Inmirania thermothiophila]|uniref:Putative nucleotidyltransferase with HDIG domain n=1 Tax=Inmirania thermothiophila TaxID=1750597 RepID=A0A3N1Y0L6_9GAMM|nr:putative nucleotidyltransferase with HDIG domain [Inmirania thermothiophila]